MCRVVIRRAPRLAWACCALLLAACGSGGAASTAMSSPRRLVAEAQRALRSARGYRLVGTVAQNGAVTHVELAIDAHGSLDLSVTNASTAFDLISVASGAFVDADAAFWTAALGPGGARLAGRWVVFPRSHARLLEAGFAVFMPATFARCLGEDLGTLTDAGTATVQGRRAIVIRDAGNAPGDAPGELAVAATGPPYPLRLATTAGQRPGGRIDVCNDGRGNGARGTVTLGEFGRVPTITAPRNPLLPTAPGQFA
jgi:hypothetical protein